MGYGKTGRREFWHCWTRKVEYEFELIERVGRWLLEVGAVLGAGAKSSFGLGFIGVQPAVGGGRF